MSRKALLLHILHVGAAERPIVGAQIRIFDLHLNISRGREFCRLVKSKLSKKNSVLDFAKVAQRLSQLDRNILHAPASPHSTFARLLIVSVRPCPNSRTNSGFLSRDLVSVSYLASR